MYTDEYLMKISDNEALKLNRSERRRREKLLTKKNKQLGISSVDNSKSDTITISKAELKRMVDSQVLQKIESIDAYRNRIFKKITFEMFYIISYVMYKYYGFGFKRMNQFIKHLTDTYYDVYMDETKEPNKSKFDELRNELIQKFRIDWFEYEYDDDDNVTKETLLDETQMYEDVRGHKPTLNTHNEEVEQ